MIFMLLKRDRLDGHASWSWYYSSTCHGRPPLVQRKNGPSWQVAPRDRERIYACAIIIMSIQTHTSDSIISQQMHNILAVSGEPTSSSSSSNTVQGSVLLPHYRTLEVRPHVGPPTPIFWGTDLSGPQRRYAGEPTGLLPNARQPTCRLPNDNLLGSRQVCSRTPDSRPVGSPTTICWGADRSAPERQIADLFI